MLYENGGLRRYYSGIGAALVQGVYPALIASDGVRGLTSTPPRSHCAIRRHCGKCWNIGTAAIKLVFERVASSDTNCVRLALVWHPSLLIAIRNLREIQALPDSE